ncbi:hypothetical protein [Prescottella equi]|uniref:hypothetical protein n=1 Tax=Rhodococcus hoagii TaxID=43767 RepID=UPI002741345C|nr:hypothetical protein [Prescottella equi]MDP8015154.1 hypothetical protein [Prescottella equi]
MGSRVSPSFAFPGSAPNVENVSASADRSAALGVSDGAHDADAPLTRLATRSRATTVRHFVSNTRLLSETPASPVYRVSGAASITVYAIDRNQFASHDVAVAPLRSTT